MKKSIYNIDYISSDGKYYIMNTSSGNVVSVNIDQKCVINKILENPESCNNERLLEDLFSMGFIIPEQTNEFQIITGKRIIKSLAQNNYLELTIMPTEKCNFRCVYCYEDFQKPKMSDTVIKAIIKYVKKNIVNRKGLIVNWFGGEPLLALDIIEKLSMSFMDICKENKKVYNSSITTNAYLLNLETFEKLRKLQVNHFQITIDGDKETHDSQRVLINGQGSFDVIMDNLKDICKNGKGNLWTISLRANITKKIVHRMEKFKNDIINPFSHDRRIYIMLRKMWTNNTEEADSLVCDEAEFEKFVYECGVSENSVYQEYTFAHNMGFMCYASNPNAYVIGSDGMVYKCTCALYDDINKVGILESSGHMKIDLEKVSYWIAPRAGANEKCKTCANYATCVSNGCPFRQSSQCDGKTLDILKYYIPQFFKIANKSKDLSDCIGLEV